MTEVLNPCGCLGGTYETYDMSTGRCTKCKQRVVFGTPLESHTTLRSGMVRSDDTDKPDYHLIDLDLVERWAKHMTAQIPAKGYNNWRKAHTEDDLRRFRASAFRHFLSWFRGEEDEDHVAAVLFNLAGAEYVKSQLESG